VKGKRDKSAQHSMGRIGDRPYSVLGLSIGIRAVHQLGAAVFLTSFLFDEIIQPPPIFLILVFSSGFFLFFTEWLRHRQIFRELSGVITFAKLLLIGAAYHGFIPTVPAIVLAFLLASVGAHAPKMIRHRLLY
jgi:NhaP-type Na+/H+ or K+/H+ antiporter